MTQRELNEEWAWTQLEAWADGSLSDGSRERMDAAIAGNPRLAAAAQRARAVQRALRVSSPAATMPRQLRRRLFAIPGGSRQGRSFIVRALASAAAAAAVVAGVLWLRPETPLPDDLDPRLVAARQDLDTAMRLLHRSVIIIEGHVANAVGTGMRDVFTVSQNAVARTTDETGG